MFEDATFNSSGVQRNETPKWMLLALACNLTLLSAAVILPLIYPDSLPTHLLKLAIYAPAPPLKGQPQPQTAHATATRTTVTNPITAPTQINKQILTTTTDSGSPEPIGDLPSSGTVPFSTGPAILVFHSDPPAAVRPSPTHPVQVSQGVAQGLIISKTLPAYPIIAKTTGTSGTVVLAATISRTGTVVNLRVLSGSPMLRQAAIDAVQTWRYRPYLLNGEPVEVETTINVVSH